MPFRVYQQKNVWVCIVFSIVYSVSFAERQHA